MLPAGLHEAQNIVERKQPFQHSRPLPYPVNASRNMQTYLEIYMSTPTKFFCTLMGVLSSAILNIYYIYLYIIYILYIS